MNLLPDAFYLPLAEAQATIAQGDIYLCPSSALLASAEREVPPGTPPTPGEDEIGASFVVRAWEEPPQETQSDPFTAPGAVHEGRWGPVMVISHECDLQKDFNALGRMMIRERGLSQEEVERLIGGRVDLDRYAVVAPVLSYEDLRRQWPEELYTELRLGDVRRGTRMDYFPLPAHPEGRLPESVVSFVRLATVERRLLQDATRIAALSEEARSVLRYKLASSLAMRDASVLSEIENAVGHRIMRTAVTPIPQKKGEKKSVSIALFLDNGEVLHLQGAPVRESVPAGPSRQLPA